jgi:BMFP domain-containing protein YqiC
MPHSPDWILFHLVSREEFDIQSELLSRTRALVEELEKKIEALEEARKP